VNAYLFFNSQLSKMFSTRDSSFQCGVVEASALLGCYVE